MIAAVPAEGAAHGGDEKSALAAVDSRHAELDRERREVEETLRALKAVSEAWEKGAIRGGSTGRASGSACGSARCGTGRNGGSCPPA
jgi:hypothetical protein